MKALLAVHRFPPYLGGSERVVHEIAEGLSAAGHSVTIATERHPARQPSPRYEVVDFDARGAELPPPERTRYRELFSRDWDLRFIYAAQSWQLDAVADLLDQRHGAADILAPVGMSQLGRPGTRTYFRDLKGWMGAFDALVFHSRKYQDYRFARLWLDEHAGPELFIIPNAAALSTATPTEQTTDVVTVSSHVRTKGHRHVVRLTSELGLTATIVAPQHGMASWRGCEWRCRAEAALRSNLRVVDGRDPATCDSREIASARCFYLPSSVECSPLVIFEAMAAAVPWVSFDVGNVSELPGGITVRSRSAAERTIRELLDDAPRREQLGQEGRQAVQSHFNWTHVRAMYVELAERVADRSTGAVRHPERRAGT